MKASIQFELESAEDFAAFATIFGIVSGGKVAPATDVVHAEAPQPDKAIPAPKVEKPAAKPAEKTKPVEKPAEKPAEKTEEPAVEAETVDKALVAKELRAFIQTKGETGPKQALGVLKEFGATKFDELKVEDYSKFLSALAKAAKA